MPIELEIMDIDGTKCLLYVTKKEMGIKPNLKIKGEYMKKLAEKIAEEEGYIPIK